MENASFVLLSVCIAAVIGYITNYLAIKMLFHPRKPIELAGRRIPFTPGLIPKRKSEISASLGLIVSEYLVTKEGLREVLDREEFRSRLADKIRQWFEKWMDNEESLEELLYRILGPSAGKALIARIEGSIEQFIQTGVHHLWQDEELFHRTIDELAEEFGVPLRGKLESHGVKWIIDALRTELQSANGDHLIRKLVHQLLDGVGGVMGMLAGMFIDEGKIVAKAKVALVQYLDSRASEEMVAGILSHQLDRLLIRTPAELIGMIRRSGGCETARASAEAAGELSSVAGMMDQFAADQLRATDSYLEDEAWLYEMLDRIMPWRSWLGKLWGLSPHELLEPHKDWLLGQAPYLADRVITFAQNQLETAMTAIDLPRLVEEQVKKFPVERLESIILSVSGREFKAITWLGALLGGLIGIIQSILLLWVL